MLQKLDILTPRYFYSAPGVKTLTNTIVDAVDSSSGSRDVYAHAYTATVADDYDEYNLYSIATDVDLAASSRYCFGLFLSQTNNLNQIFTCKSTYTFLAESASSFRCYYIFGRLGAATVTASDAAASNLLATYSLISSNTATLKSSTGITGEYEFSGCIDKEIVCINTGTSYPVFFGLVIETTTAVAYNINNLQASFSFRSNAASIPVYTPGGV